MCMGRISIKNGIVPNIEGKLSKISHVGLKVDGDVMSLSKDGYSKLFSFKGYKEGVTTNANISKSIGGDDIKDNGMPSDTYWNLWGSLWQNIHADYVNSNISIGKLDSISSGAEKYVRSIELLHAYARENYAYKGAVYDLGHKFMSKEESFIQEFDSMGVKEFVSNVDLYNGSPLDVYKTWEEKLDDVISGKFH